MRVGSRYYKDIMINTGYSPGYGHIFITVELNRGDKREIVEIELGKRDVKQLKQQIEKIEELDCNLSEKTGEADIVQHLDNWIEAVNRMKQGEHLVGSEERR